MEPIIFRIASLLLGALLVLAAIALGYKVDRLAIRGEISRANFKGLMMLAGLMLTLGIYLILEALGVQLRQG